eukprot:3091512-Pyramimonas_sp.AAC.1
MTTAQSIERSCRAVRKRPNDSADIFDARNWKRLSVFNPSLWENRSSFPERLINASLALNYTAGVSRGA